MKNDKPLDENDAPEGCVAVDHPVSVSCFGCCYEDSLECLDIMEADCTAEYRADGHTVIFHRRPT